MKKTNKGLAKKNEEKSVSSSPIKKITTLDGHMSLKKNLNLSKISKQVHNNIINPNYQKQAYCSNFSFLTSILHKVFLGAFENQIGIRIVVPCLCLMFFFWLFFWGLRTNVVMWYESIASRKNASDVFVFVSPEHCTSLSFTNLTPFNSWSITVRLSLKVHLCPFWTGNF